MMFGAPLLITGLLYFAFGSLASDGERFNLQSIRVQVANLDQPGTQGDGLAAGQMLVEFLQSEDLADLLEVIIAADEASARASVEGQQADVAVIIPPSFTAAVLAPEREAAVNVYSDPTLTIGPAIVEDLVGQFVDGFAGAKIAAGVAAKQLEAQDVTADRTVTQNAAMQYADWQESSGHDHAQADGGSTLFQTRSPSGAPSGDRESSGEGAGMIGRIMAGMMIFFAFFMGALSAESIIREDEEGTLERLFTTPTPQAAILGGKFTAIVLTLVVQIVVLLVAARLIFDIGWGQPLPVALVTLGLIVAAAGFGVLLMSFVKSTRQTGPVMGGVLTLTGMLGGLFTTGVPNLPEAFDTVRLSMPQGWALYAWELTLNGAGVSQVLVPVAVLLGLGALFFGAGVILFRKRFA
jgi:ABC-2 type transport system permease protein